METTQDLSSSSHDALRSSYSGHLNATLRLPCSRARIKRPARFIVISALARLFLSFMSLHHDHLRLFHSTIIIQSNTIIAIAIHKHPPSCQLLIPSSPAPSPSTFPSFSFPLSKRKDTTALDDRTVPTVDGLSNSLIVSQTVCAVFPFPFSSFPPQRYKT